MSVQFAKIESIAASAIGDDMLAAHWLRRSSPLLGGRCPMEAICTQEGRHRVLCLLAWYSGKPIPVPAPASLCTSDQADEATELMLDESIELVFKSAGAGPEEHLSFER